nr:MAG TPA: hypothetical protein [Caudoviricetes sp.]
MRNYLMCDRCGFKYDEISVRQKCPHPAVNRKFGEHICVCCCQKCKFSERVSGGLTCNYGKEGEVKSVKDNHHY